MKAKKAAGLRETRRIRRRRRWRRKGQGRRRRWRGERGKEEGVEEGKKKRIEEEVGWSGVLLAGEGARLLVGLTKYCSVTLAWQPYQL